MQTFELAKGEFTEDCAGVVHSRWCSSHNLNILQNMLENHSE